MTFGKLLMAWLIIVPGMVANGIVRELVIKRFTSGQVADLISAATGIAIVLGVTRLTLRPLAGKSDMALVSASVTLVLLTVAFDLLFGHYVDRKSWSDLVGNYAIWRGKPWPVVLAMIAFTPFLWGRWSIAEVPHVR